MNAVGVIGNFLVNNQVIVEAALLLLLAIIVAWILVKKFIQKPKQDQTIKELQDKIESLESKLNNIDGTEASEGSGLNEGEKDTPQGESPEEELSEEEKERAEILRRIREDDYEDEEEYLTEKLEETIELKDLVLDSAEEGFLGQPHSKYTNRNWGEDRHGNVYTEEMLKDQIN